MRRRQLDFADTLKELSTLPDVYLGMRIMQWALLCPFYCWENQDSESFKNSPSHILGGSVFDYNFPVFALHQLTAGNVGKTPQYGYWDMDISWRSMSLHPQITHSQAERFLTEILCNFKNLPIKLLKTLHTFSKKCLHPSSHPNALQTLGSKCPGNRLFGNLKVLMPCGGEAAKHSIGTCMKRKKCRWWKSPIPCWLLPQGSEEWCTGHQSIKRTFILSDCTAEQPPWRAQVYFAESQWTSRGLAGQVRDKV